MRERSRVLIPETLSNISYTFTTLKSDNTTTVATEGPWTVKSHSETQKTVDTVTPNFAEAISRGEIINNNFSTSRIKYRRPQPCSYNLTKSRTVIGSPRGYESEIRSGTSVWPASTRLPMLSVGDRSQLRQAVVDLAVQRAHANVDASSMLALASAAESRQTIDFFLSSAHRLHKVIKDVRTLNFKSLSKQISPKELRNRYMEYRYAVRPLIADVNGLISAMSNDRKYDRFTARGYASDTVSASNTIVGHGVAWSMLADVRQEASYTVSARAGVLTQVTYTNTNIFGVDQLAETAWELVPFSFIVDWFVNVGQAIAAVSPNAGVTQLASWCTVKEAYVATNTLEGVRAAPDPYWDRTLEGSLSGSDGYDELVVTRFAEPVLNVWPLVETRLDTFKILDLISILSQSVGKR